MERCELVKNVEKHLNITKIDKRVKTNSIIGRVFDWENSRDICHNLAHLENNIDGFRNKIYFGGNILEYYTHR